MAAKHPPVRLSLPTRAVGKRDFAKGFNVNGAHLGIIRLVTGVPCGIYPDIVIGLEQVTDEGLEVVEVL